MADAQKGSRIHDKASNAPAAAKQTLRVFLKIRSEQQDWISAVAPEACQAAGAQLPSTETAGTDEHSELLKDL